MLVAVVIRQRRTASTWSVEPGWLGAIVDILSDMAHPEINWLIRTSKLASRAISNRRPIAGTVKHCNAAVGIIF